MCTPAANAWPYAAPVVDDSPLRIAPNSDVPTASRTVETHQPRRSRLSRGQRGRKPRDGRRADEGSDGRHARLPAHHQRRLIECGCCRRQPSWRAGKDDRRANTCAHDETGADREERHDEEQVLVSTEAWPSKMSPSPTITSPANQRPGGCSASQRPRERPGNDERDDERRLASVARSGDRRWAI